MKKLVVIILILTSYKVAHSDKLLEYEEMLPEIVLKMNPVLKYRNDFLNDLGQRESSNKYHVVNSSGYMGKYQFGMSTLKTLKIKTTKEKFLNSPWLQELAMKLNLKYNKKLLKDIIKEHSGTIIDSITITESGILAGAHLGGAGSVKKYFNELVDKHDSNGTTVTNYMKKFSGYNLAIN